MLHWQAEYFVFDTRDLLRHFDLDRFVRENYRTVWSCGEFEIRRRR